MSEHGLIIRSGDTINGSIVDTPTKIMRPSSLKPFRESPVVFLRNTCINITSASALPLFLLLIQQFHQQVHAHYIGKFTPSTP
jgi:hypothetical protein